MAERKQRGEILRESEERYRSLFDKASDGIFIISPDGILIEVNESFARMHGYSTGELLQMNIRDLDTTKTASLIPERMRRLLAGEILTIEVEHHHKDGHVFPLEVSANLISSWKTLHPVFSPRYHRAQAGEEEIRKHEEYLRVALSTTNMAVFNQDLDLRYSWMYQPQLGYITEQVIGKRDAELLPSDLAQQVTELKRRVLETGVAADAADQRHVERQEYLLRSRHSADAEHRRPIRRHHRRVFDIPEEAAEEALREREEQLATILRTATDGFWVTDCKGRLPRGQRGRLPQSGLQPG